MAKPRKPKLELSPEALAAFAAFGRLGGLKGGAKGGKTTASRRTPEERRAAMRHALEVRLAKQRAAKKAKAAASVPKPKTTRKKT